jgi:hypothetical protein
MTFKTLFVAAAWVVFGVAGNSFANSVYISEFCSDTGNNEKFEFVEFTNVGSTPVDMTGWSEDDSNATPNKPGHSLSAFGILAPGESAIFTEATPAAFKAYWWGSTPPTGLKVVGPYTNDNLNTTGDSITLFDNAGALVDRLDYTAPNSADAVTRNAPFNALGLNNNSLWMSSQIGDTFGSFHAAQKLAIIGNPGHYPVPEPSTLLMACAAGAGILLAARRRRSA